MRRVAHINISITYEVTYGNDQRPDITCNHGRILRMGHDSYCGGFKSIITVEILGSIGVCIGPR
jgi:hypothetical protein